MSRFEKASSMLGVEKLAAEEPSGHRILARLVRHRNCTSDGRIPLVEKTDVFWRRCGMGGLACCPLTPSSTQASRRQKGADPQQAGR